MVEARIWASNLHDD